MSVQERDPCPHRILDDIGGAFAMGAIGGGVWNSVKGARNSPRGERLLGSIMAVRARAPVLGGAFPPAFRSRHSPPHLTPSFAPSAAPSLSMPGSQRLSSAGLCLSRPPPALTGPTHLSLYRRQLCRVGRSLLLVRLHARLAEKKGGPLELDNLWRCDRRRPRRARRLAGSQPIRCCRRYPTRHDRGAQHLPDAYDGRIVAAAVCARATGGPLPASAAIRADATSFFSANAASEAGVI